MAKPIDIVVVGGGTAGWLTACLLAADHGRGDSPRARIQLVESANVPSIGVGEGTWPSMRSTLQRIGISERDFIVQCDASFKQGSTFQGWRTGASDDQYHHPFTLPAGYPELNLGQHWLPFQSQVEFSNAATAQGRIGEMGLAPKSRRSSEYSAALNYGYHLDAGKFAQLLQQHGTEKLGIRHIIDDVLSVQGGANEPISALNTKEHGQLKADLYIDCSGFAGLLIDKHYQVPLQSVRDCLFNDAAIAIQVPYGNEGENENERIASNTIASAQTHGWTWDIGLYSRRGVGYVYASDFTDAEQAETTLRQHIAKTSSNLSESQIEQLQAKHIKLNPGYRSSFWQHNCVAIGLSAGFIEPLEASAIALVEVAAKYVSEHLTIPGELHSTVAKRFNQTMTAHWQKIIDFLKLHYVLSKRNDSEYWLAHRDERHWSQWLRESVQLWQHNGPGLYDLPMAMEMFPAASFQYIWYGMNRGASMQPMTPDINTDKAANLFQQVAQQTRALAQSLPDNRELLMSMRNQ